MNAPVKIETGDWQPALAAAMLRSLENEALLAKGRQMVADRYIAGWITSDHALEILIGMGLIEFSPELLAESEAAG